MDRNESLSSQIERDIEDSVQIKQELKAYGELVSEIQMYKTAAFRLAKTNDELLEQLTYVEAERDALREQTRWIPVEERLPEKSNWVLVSGNKLVSVGYFDSIIWWSADDLRFPFEPTHWMPLPPAPKEGEE